MFQWIFTHSFIDSCISLFPVHPPTGYSYIHSPVVHTHSASLPYEPGDFPYNNYPPPHGRVSTSSAPGVSYPPNENFISPPPWASIPAGIPEGFKDSRREMSVHMMGANVSQQEHQQQQQQQQQTVWANGRGGGGGTGQDKRVAFLAQVRGREGNEL